MSYLISENKEPLFPLKTTPTLQQLKYKNFRSITIEDHQPQDIYTFLKDFNHLKRFMKGVEEIRPLSNQQFHWKIRLKTGLFVEWDVEIIEDVPNSMIRWHSLPQSNIDTKGVIWLTKAPNSTGTVVSISMDCDLPGGSVTGFAAIITGDDPNNLIQTNLHRLKAYLETGEIPTIQGQSSGREDRSITKH